jgi:transposase InsO family protein
LLDLPRASYYYQPAPESAANLTLMRQIDELYREYPFLGSRRMAAMLDINRKHAQRLMRLMGLEAHYAKPHLSRPAPGHEIYPYLLRDVPIVRPNHVWSGDITYIPLASGFTSPPSSTGSAALCLVVTGSSWAAPDLAAVAAHLHTHTVNGPVWQTVVRGVVRRVERPASEQSRRKGLRIRTTERRSELA